MSSFSDYFRALQGATTPNHLILVIAQDDGYVWITRRGDLVLNLKIRGMYSSLMMDNELRHAKEALTGSVSEVSQVEVVGAATPG